MSFLFSLLSSPKKLAMVLVGFIVAGLVTYGVGIGIVVMIGDHFIHESQKQHQVQPSPDTSKLPQKE